MNELRMISQMPGNPDDVLEEEALTPDEIQVQSPKTIHNLLLVLLLMQHADGHAVECVRTDGI